MICSHCQKRLSRKTARQIDGVVMCSTCMFKPARDRDGAEGRDAKAARGPQARQARAEGIAQNVDPNSTIPIVKPGGEIPEGWIAHDGGPCPVAPESKPGVMSRNRSGESTATMTIPPGMYPARAWAKAPLSWTNGIIAYKPSDDSGGI